MDDPISLRRPDQILIWKKKISSQQMDFAVPKEDRVKGNVSEKLDKYLNIVRELKLLWNMKVTVIPIMIKYSRLGM